MFQTFSIDSLAFFNAIIAPQFGDLAKNAVGYRGTLNEFTLMDNVPTSRPIIDISRTQNIMQRRDASCDIVYKNLFGASVRKVTTTELVGAVKFCRNEFYQGCLKDFRSKDPLFGNKILPYFKSAINTDVTTNSYFGDVNRTVSATAKFSTDLYDGVFKWIKFYQTNGVIPAGQSMSIADGTDFAANPTTAFTLIKSMHDKMPDLMRLFTDAELAYYVSPQIYRGYEDYLIAAGIGNDRYTTDVMTGLPALKYKNIVLLEEPLWTPVITEIKGSAGYAAVLTIRGNFIFATDKDYGEGENGKTALEVWYDTEAMTWKYRMFLKAGTQIALPEFIIYALTSWT